MASIEEVLKSQADFCEQVMFTFMLLKIYAGNPSQFEHLLGDEVIKEYHYSNDLDAEVVWEALEELSYDLCHDHKKFVIVESGIFPSLHFAKAKKKRHTLDDIVERFKIYTDGPWTI